MNCKVLSRTPNPRLVGDPVDVVTGACTDISGDFKLAGPLPLLWNRYYNSDQNKLGRSLGWGHGHEYDRRLLFEGETIHYADQAGSTVEFSLPGKDGEEVAASGFILRRVSEKNYSIYPRGEPFMVFERQEPGLSARLDRVCKGDLSISFRYGENGYLKAIVDAQRRLIRAETDAEGRLTALISTEWRKGVERPLVRYGYDGKGNLIHGTDPYGNTFRYKYDSYNRMICKTDRRGYSFFFEYDEDGRCVDARGEDGLHEVKLKYLPEENTTIVVKVNREWTYSYDENGTITYITDPYGVVKELVLDNQDHIARPIDREQSAGKWLYFATGTPAGEMFSLRKPMTGVEDRNIHQRFEHRMASCPMEWEYGDLIDRPLITNAAATPLAAKPGAAQAQDSSASASPARGEISSDPNQQETDTKEAYLFYDGQVFDAFGKLIKEQGPSGEARRWLYDANGNIQRYTDRDGARYMYEYSSWNLFTRDIEPLGREIRYQYTSSEQIAAVTDPGETTSKYHYDLKDRLVEIDRHGSVREQYGYDDTDNITEKLDGEGKTLLRFEIDPDGRQQVRRLASGGDHHFEYDEYRRLVRAAADQTKIQFYYDEDGNRVGEERNGRGVRRRVFDTSGLSVTTVFGRFVIKNNASTDGSFIIQDPGAHSHSIQVNGDQLRRTMSGRVSETSQYNADGRCLRKTVAREPRRSKEWVREFKYSGEGDLLMVSDNLEGKTVYRYDGAHRLVRVVYPGGSEQTFRYDAADNLLQQPGLAGVSLGAVNRLAAANGQQFSYGSHGAVSLRDGDGRSVRYFYDSLNMLTRVESTSGVWRCAYDPLGRRTSKSFGGKTVDYYWDGDRVAAEVRNDGSLRIYIYADCFALVPLMFMEYPATDANPASGSRYFIFCDHGGRPVLVEDDAGGIVWRARLEAYGFAHIDPASTIEMPLRFPGHYFDSETGLHYNRFRYYSPELGCYLQPDPAGMRGSWNLYAYSRNPLKEVDVYGLSCPPEDMRRIQNDNLGPDELGYRKWPDQIWKWFGRERAPSKGFKIHISSAVDNADIVARSVLPKLREMDVPHKVAPTTERYARLGDQQGKLITIYAKDAAEAQRIMNAIDPELKDLRDYGGVEPGPLPTTRQSGHKESEIRVGKSGMASTHWYDETGEN
jgi:RHS repeat-associated protein